MDIPHQVLIHSFRKIRRFYNEHAVTFLLSIPVISSDEKDFLFCAPAINVTFCCTGWSRALAISKACWDSIPSLPLPSILLVLTLNSFQKRYYGQT